MADLDKMIEEIEKMTVLELNELVKKIEDKFGVSAAAMAVAAPAGGAAAPAAEEQTEFTVILKDIGPNKIPVIKVVRELTSLGLGEAKALVDGAPSTIKENVAKAEAEEIANKFKEVGATVEGKVERVTSFGAFVSVNGFDCLAHISDLSWTGVKEVTDVLEIGKRYQFKVLKIDRENKKVSIGYKQLQPEPWDLAAEKYAEGDVVHGKVVRIVPFGAFVELEKGIDGLVHVSQITHEWLENPTSVLSIGEEIDAKVLAFNPAERKITLSIKALQPQPEVEPYYMKEKDRDEGKSNNRKARKGGRKNFSDDDEDYREWNEGGFGGVSIADLLGGENK